jgi:DHA1 family tetracycline resistance protein-like MFS transporter
LIFLTVLIDLIGFGIILPIFPIFARELTHQNEMMVGLLLTSYSLMQFLFVPVLGRLSDRMGRKPVLIVSVIGTCVSFLLMGYALLPGVRSLPLLFLSRILDGISGANISAAQAYIADVTTAENRAKGMGIIGAAFGLGFILGPAVGGALAHYGWQVPAFVAAGLSAVNALGIATILPESLKEKGRHTGEDMGRWSLISRVAKRPEIALPVFVFFLGQLAASISQVAFPLFMSDPNLHWRLGTQSIGYLFAYIGLVVAFIQGGLIGRLVKRLGEVRVAWIGLFVLAVSYFLFPNVSTRPMLYLVLAGMAFGQGAMIPSLNSLVSRRSGAEEQGGILGVNQSMASLARVIGPLWAGWTYHSFAPASSYYSAAAVLVVALVAALSFGKP